LPGCSGLLASVWCACVRVCHGQRFKRLGFESTDPRATFLDPLGECALEFSDGYGWAIYFLVSICSPRFFGANSSMRLSFAGTLREAITRLVSDALVEAEGQRGFRVVPISMEDLADLTELRLHIELDALRQSMRHGDEQ